MENAPTRAEGLRARKQRQTEQRIIDVAMKLFLENGFDATTVDALAAAADISRRSFFHYFESKEDILAAIERGAEDAFRAALSQQPEDTHPLVAVRDALLTMIAHYDSDEAIAIDTLMRSTPALRARKQANYITQEAALFAALAQKWPDPARQQPLRLVAMIGIGAMRLAADRWHDGKGRQMLESYLVAMFDTLWVEVPAACMAARQPNTSAGPSVVPGPG